MNKFEQLMFEILRRTKKRPIETSMEENIPFILYW